MSASAGVKAALLGTTTRKNGALQVTYKGHPLYLFKLDHGAGQIAGQGLNFFGGKWYVVSAAGAPTRPRLPPGGTTTTSTTSTTNCGVYGCP